MPKQAFQLPAPLWTASTIANGIEIEVPSSTNCQNFGIIQIIKNKILKMVPTVGTKSILSNTAGSLENQH